MFEKFSIVTPDPLLETLGSWYFIGTHGTTRPNPFLIIGVKQHGDALVWMRNWEKDMINSLSTLFPSGLKRAGRETTTSTQKLIDNKTVRTLTNNNADGQPLSYYFFNQSILVIVVGDEDTITEVNRRIRQANT